MDVSVRHVDSGRGCVVSVPDDGTVVSLKVDALKEMFADSINAEREAAVLVARIEGCEEELDDAEHVANTGLEDGDGVQLVGRWPHIKAPAVYERNYDDNDESGNCVTLSRCGKLCSVGDSTGRVNVVDTSTADEVAHLTHGEKDIWYTSFSVCGTWLATCSGDNTICVWLTTTWERVWCLEEHIAPVWSAAWTHCGRLVSGDNDGTVRVWDLEGTPSATVLEGHSGTVYGIAASTTRLFTGSWDKTVRVYDISTFPATHTDTLCEHTDGLYDVALTQDEQRLVSCSGDKSLKVWCTTTLACLRTVVLEEDPYAIFMSQPGDVVAVGCSQHIKLFTLSTFQCLGQVDAEGEGVALSPCGRWVFLPSEHSVDVRAVCDVPREDIT